MNAFRVFHEYDAATGLLSGRQHGFSDSPGLDAYIRDRFRGSVIELSGPVDALSQRVDTETRLLVDYQPPAPDANHEWSHAEKRWHLRADIAQRRAARAAALAKITELETQQQPRALRELTLDPANVTAIERLTQIDQAIAELRETLRATAEE